MFYLVIQTQELAECGEGHTHRLQVSYIKSNKVTFSDIIYGLTGCSPAFPVKILRWTSSYQSRCTDQSCSNQLGFQFNIIIDLLQSWLDSSLWYSYDLEYISSFFTMTTRLTSCRQSSAPLSRLQSPTFQNQPSANRCKLKWFAPSLFRNSEATLNLFLQSNDKNTPGKIMPQL